MASLLLPVLSSMFLLIVVGANYEALEPKAYWDKVLPHTSMPSAIQQFFSDAYVDEKAATSVNVGKGGVNVGTGKGTSVNVGKAGVNVGTGKGTSVNVGKPGVNVGTGKGTSVNVGKGGVHVGTGKGTTVNVGRGGVGVRTAPKGKPVVVHVNPIGSPFNYLYASSDTQSNDDPAAAFFFLPADLRPGRTFNLQLASPADGASPTFLPRREADAVPFSSSALPSILSHFNLPPNSREAAAMKATLQDCEAGPAAGETRRCATSLEAMVDFATARLGKNVAAVSTEGGGLSAAERRPYKVAAVRRVAQAGGKGVVACHPEAYPYAVFLCHATSSADVYEVDLSATNVRAAAVAVAVAVCHTDTSGWNPKHVAFRVLGVGPGKSAVCHFLPRDHVVWASKE